MAFLNYIMYSGFPYNSDGTFCCGQNDYADTSHTIVEENNVLQTVYADIYWNKWFTSLSGIEMCSYFIHEMLHAEFFRWIVEGTYPNPVYISNFSSSSLLWRSIVVEKYGEDTDPNHHALMNYFVDNIASDLWELNGESDPNRKEYYKYFAYDLFAPDEELVSRGFLTLDELNYLKELNNSVISNIDCNE